MIRPATIDDMPDLLRLAFAAHEGAGLSRPNPVNGFWFPLDAEIAQRQIMSHLSSPSSLCLVYTVNDTAHGAVVAAATNYPNAPLRLAAEVTFWVEPRFRGRAGPRLLKAFEAWGKAQGCHFAHMSDKNDPRFAKWLRREGYGPIETQFLKVL